MISESFKKVISISGDPGGAAALAPVLKSLPSKDPWKLTAFSYRQSSLVLQKCDVPSVALADSTSASDVAEIFDRECPDLVIAASSSNGLDLELSFIAEARKRDIPSISLVEFWSNYEARFLRGQNWILPDAIAVADEDMRRDMVKCGFSSDVLHVCGHPAVEETLAARKNFERLDPSVIREELGLEQDGLHFLFVSQPLYPDWNTPDFDKLYRGFSKKTILPALIHTLENLSKKHGQKIHLVIRPHGREAEEDFSWISSSEISIKIIRTGDPKRILRAFSVVSGMDSALLLEAALLGCVVLSLQAGGTKSDALPSNRWGLSIPVYQEDQISPMVEAAAFDEALRDKVKTAFPPLASQTSAVDRFLHLMHEKISASSPLKT